MDSKKEKQLAKALKLAGIDKEKFDQVIDLLSDDEEETKEQPKEEPKEVKEEPKVEEKKAEVKEEPKETPKKDETLEKLLLFVEKQQEQIKQLTEKVEKSQSFGYSSQPKTSDDNDLTDILTKAQNLR